MADKDREKNKYRIPDKDEEEYGGFSFNFDNIDLDELVKVAANEKDGNNSIEKAVTADLEIQTKSQRIIELEQSLINFLIQKRDIDEKVSGGARRIRALNFNINLKDPNNPFFTVQIGMCEAAFNTKNGLKERGSCFGIERYIRDWFERPSVKDEIENIIANRITELKKKH